MSLFESFYNRAIPIRITFETDGNMKKQIKGIKLFGLYTFVVSGETDPNKAVPLFIYIPHESMTPQYKARNNIARGITGINLRETDFVQQPRLVDAMIREYQNAVTIKDDTLRTNTLRAIFVRYQPYFKKAYKYYEWQKIDGGLFRELPTSYLSDFLEER